MSTASPSEIGVLIILGVLIFGPEKLPEFARKAARVTHSLKNIANSTRDQLRDELGPEFADLDYRDLNPKNFVRKYVINGMQDDIDDLRSDLHDVQTALDLSTVDDPAATSAVSESQSQEESVEVVDGMVVPFDVEAT